MHEQFEDVKENIKQIKTIAEDMSGAVAWKREKHHYAIIIILIVLLVATNFGWLIYESKMETVEETAETVTIEGVSQNAEGNNNIIGGDYVGDSNDQAD